MYSNPTLTAIVVVVLAIVAMALLLAQRNKALFLRRRFGREYDRTVTERGSELEAQAVLEQRQNRVAHLNIRTLSPAERVRYANAWRLVQSRFIDDPKGALNEAEDTVISVMKAQGYPTSGFAQRVPDLYVAQRAADLSVEHPNVVQNYRTAHDITVRHRGGHATREDLRRAMVCYRCLFEDLLSGRSTNVANDPVATNNKTLSVYIEELKDIYNAEKQLTIVLPMMARAASSGDLRNGINENLQQTRIHIERLEQILDALGERPSLYNWVGTEGLMEEASEVADNDFKDDIMDAALVSGAHRVEQAKIAAYGTACAFAEQLAEPEHISLLRQTLDEEKQADAKLTELSNEINTAAGDQPSRPASE